MELINKFLRAFGRKPKLDLTAVNIGNFGKWSPGPPTYEPVPEGECQFGEEFQKVYMTHRLQISPDTYVFTFQTPDPTKPLNLPTCACVIARAEIDGEIVERPYTPCSANTRVGSFDLMIKIYPDGKMTQHLNQLTPPNGAVEFKFVPFNIKLQYPFEKKFIGMVVGGTGITPMIQALHALLGNKDDKTEIRLLYGNKSSENILGLHTLENWTKLNDRLQVTYVLSEEPEDSNWPGLRGLITKEVIMDTFPPPGNDMMIFVCGTPQMYESICGPRADKTVVSGALGEIGYSSDEVYKF